MGRKATSEIKDEPGEPMVARSKMGEATVSELEVKGIENLTEMEKKHLLLQLSRDKVKNKSAGPWEITDIRRDEWRGLKNTLAQPTALTQPVEIDLKDIGRDALIEVSIDITKLERELEAQRLEVKDLEAEKDKKH
ncbi:MAG: hypothetical protein ABFD07_03240 [Methanobacterium sp.]